jgi:probable F420-dependent oxidoreductase
MKLGLALPNLSPLGTRANILRFARDAEAMGFDSLWVTERILFPLQPRQPYAGSQAWPEVYKYVLDPLDTLIFAAAVTEKIRLGTSVLDFPFYTPARLAKRIATLDVLSNGRTLLGAGVGWSEDEFIASNVPFNQRSGRMTEMIHALNALWGDDPVEFHGKYFDIPATLFNPKPLQKPRPPLLLGGFAPAAVKRAARLADGFNPVAIPNAAAVEGAFAAMRRAWQEAGREPAAPEIIVRVNHGFISDHPLEGERLFLTGSVEQVRGDVQQLAKWGATEVFFSLRSHLPAEGDVFAAMLEQMRLLRGVKED